MQQPLVEVFRSISRVDARKVKRIRRQVRRWQIFFKDFRSFYVCTYYIYNIYNAHDIVRNYWLRRNEDENKATESYLINRSRNVQCAPRDVD